MLFWFKWIGVVNFDPFITFFNLVVLLIALRVRILMLKMELLSVFIATL